MAPSVPKCPGVSKISAPRAFKIFCRSTLANSDMVNRSLYAFTEHTRANPMPVFPLVASITVLSGVSSPDFSPFSIIKRAALSLMEPPGLKYSSFARIFTLGFGLRFFISTRGVLPMVSRIEWVIITILRFFVRHFRHFDWFKLLNSYKTQ